MTGATLGTAWVDEPRAHPYGVRETTFLPLAEKVRPVTQLFQTLREILPLLLKLVGEVLRLTLHWWLLLLWIAWWLKGVNWQKAWPVLARGAWVPLVLVNLMGALVWSRLYPQDLRLGETSYVPNFWWQLAAVGMLTGSALFCGWLQGVFGWAPAEIELEPVLAEHGHGAEHGHAAGHGH